MVSGSKPLLEALGSALRDAREEHGLSQGELARRTGVHRVYVVGIEGGKRNPSVVAVAKLADGIGIPIDEIFKRAQDRL